MRELLFGLAKFEPITELLSLLRLRVLSSQLLWHRKSALDAPSSGRQWQQSPAEAYGALHFSSEWGGASTRASDEAQIFGPAQSAGWEWQPCNFRRTERLSSTKFKQKWQSKSKYKETLNSWQSITNGKSSIFLKVHGSQPKTSLSSSTFHQRIQKYG